MRLYMASNMSASTRNNPFVGPRPLKNGEPLHGRDREALDLSDLLIAERIVLLYSPSGAGKTSLIQAGLLPLLRSEGFRVMPAMRVSLRPSQEQCRDLPPNHNRYVLSALLSLEELWPVAKQIPLPDLAAISLSEYLERWKAAENDETQEQRVVLVFDQFEEILTVEPADHDAKIEFFTQLGAALRQPNWSALMAMREEFLAGLDPYQRYLPTRLKNTFRLDLLSPETACRIAEQSAEAGGVPFSPSAAQKLADDLCSIQVQQPDGSLEEHKGAHVEPVQLQVVCYQLWEHLPEGTPRIEEAHLQAAGDVNAALAAYYADCVKAAAEQSGVQEKLIREWVSAHLITSHGFRGQVMGGSKQSQELKQDALVSLLNAHLIRGERRRGATWYELAHDRLIKPIRKNNETWFQEHLSLLQRQAALWEQHGRTDDLLFYGESLQRAEAWVKEQQPALNEHEREFLAACRKEKNARTNMQRLASVTQFAIIVSLLALVFFALALLANQRQKAASRTARENALEAAMTSAHHKFLSGEDELGALFAAVKNGKLLKETHANDRLKWQAAFNLRDILAGIHEKNRFDGHLGPVMSVAFSPDGTRLASGGMEKTIRLWPVLDGASSLPIENGGNVYGLSFNRDGSLLAAGGEDGQVKLWKTQTHAFEPFSKHAAAVYSLSFSPDGKWLASSDFAGRIRVQHVPDGTLLRNFSTLSFSTPGGLSAWSVRFSPDGARIAVAYSKYIRVWNVADQTVFGTFSGHAALVRNIAFSPDGSLLASGSQDRTIKLWDMQRRTLRATIAHSNGIRDLLFLPHSSIVAGGDDGALTFWDVNSRRVLKTLAGHEGWVRSLSVSPDGTFIASGSMDRSIRLWNIMSEEEQLTFTGKTFASVNSVSFASDGQAAAWSAGDYLLFKRSPSTLRKWHVPDIIGVSLSPDGQFLASWQKYGTMTFRKAASGEIFATRKERGVSLLSFSADSRLLALGYRDGAIMLWNMPDLTLRQRLSGHHASISSLTFSADGKWLASHSRDKTVKLWHLTGGTVFRTFSSHNGSISSLAFSADGKWLAEGGQNKKITLWETGADRAFRTFSSYAGAIVWSLSISPDHHFLASGNNSMMTIWSVPELKKLGTLAGHTDTVMGVKFTNNTTGGGIELASASQDEVFKHWRIGDLDDQLRRGCDWLQDYLRQSGRLSDEDRTLCDD